MSEGIKFSDKELNFINLFELITSVKVKDCIIDDEFNRAIFIVDPKDVGLAVGKGGIKVQYFKKLTKYDAEVLPFYNDVNKMIESCFLPFKVNSIKIIQNQKGDKVALVYVDIFQKAQVIGAKGKNVQRAKLVTKRYFDIKNIIIV